MGKLLRNIKSIVILLEILGTVWGTIVFVHKRVGALKKTFTPKPQEKKK